MNGDRLRLAAAGALGSLTLVVALAASATVPPTEGSPAVTRTARGPFDVKVAPIAQTEHAGGTTLGRFSLDKTFHGDLQATSVGEMLTAGTAVKGSAGYVAIERVDGTLAGRKGTFVLQHSGSMSAGGQSLTITVVPDSGTGALTGITGKLAIEIDGKAHSYRFDYTLPEAARAPAQ
jgi:hypothetical protein